MSRPNDTDAVPRQGRPLPATAVLSFALLRDGTIVSAWPRVGPSSGRTPATIFDLIHAEDRSPVRAALERVFYAAAPERLECRFTAMRPGGWYHCRLAPNVTAEGVVSATLVACEVTEWKAVEHAVERERDRLDALLDAEIARLRTVEGWPDAGLTGIGLASLLEEAGEAIFVTDARTGTLVDVNATACAWVGKAHDDLRGLPIGDLHLAFPTTPPRLRDTRGFTETRQTLRPWVAQVGVHRRRDGSTFPVEVTILPKRTAGGEYHLILARDIKRRRATEEARRDYQARYRALFELTGDAVYELARDGTVLEANAAAADLLGYERGDMVGLDMRALHVSAADVRRFRAAMERSGTVSDLPVQLWTKRGARCHVRITAVARHDTGGTVVGYLCVARPGSAPRWVAEPPDDAAAGAAPDDATSGGDTPAAGRDVPTRSPHAPTSALAAPVAQVRTRVSVQSRRGPVPLPAAHPAAVWGAAMAAGAVMVGAGARTVLLLLGGAAAGGLVGPFTASDVSAATMGAAGPLLVLMPYGSSTADTSVRTSCSSSVRSRSRRVSSSSSRA